MLKKYPIEKPMIDLNKSKIKLYTILNENEKKIKKNKK